MESRIKSNDVLNHKFLWIENKELYILAEKNINMTIADEM